MAFYFPRLDDAQSQGQQNESDSDPLGHLSQLGVEALGLTLGKEVVSTAADGTGDAGALTGLEEDDDDEEERGDQKKNAESDSH